MDRETVEFTLPMTKKVVKIKAWITGREFEELQKPIYSNYKTKTDSAGNKEVETNNGAIFEELNKKGIEIYLVSIDDKTDNLLDVALDLPYPDYKEIKDQIDLVSKKKEEV